MDAEQHGGTLTQVQGHINLNTATREALRMMIAGCLKQDPQIRAFTGASHSEGSTRFPEVSQVSPSLDISPIAGRIADAIIRSRPFASTGELANAREWKAGAFSPVFGNARLFPEYGHADYPCLQWTDAAAEETFARMHETATVRSRNFRVWIIGQSLAPPNSADTPHKVLSEVRRNYTLFADPGERQPDGSIDPGTIRIRVSHEKIF